METKRGSVIPHFCKYSKREISAHLSPFQFTIPCVCICAMWAQYCKKTLGNESIPKGTIKQTQRAKMCFCVIYQKELKAMVMWMGKYPPGWSFLMELFLMGSQKELPAVFPAGGRMNGYFFLNQKRERKTLPLCLNLKWLRKHSCFWRWKHHTLGWNGPSGVFKVLTPV